MPETSSANAGTSDQVGLCSFPRTTASWTAPATSATCAQSACARRCIVEKVEKIAITHSPTLEHDDDGREEIGAPGTPAEDLGADDQPRR